LIVKRLDGNSKLQEETLFYLKMGMTLASLSTDGKLPEVKERLIKAERIDHI